MAGRVGRLQWAVVGLLPFAAVMPAAAGVVVEIDKSTQRNATIGINR